MGIREIVRLFFLFGIKQAYACLFGAYLLAVIIATAFWYPLHDLHRYDFLFLAAVTFQVFLIATRLESKREVLVILVFHVLATLMELFKTSPGIGSWHYPGRYVIGIADVPLFAGFMYSAVGSYIARVWRVFEFRFSHYPPAGWTVLLVAAIYANFFTHHFFFDIRWILVVFAFALYGRTMIYFKVADRYLRMPLLLGFLLVSLFIWLAENISTLSSVWIYPNQQHGWHMVPYTKLVAWWLLMMISFVLVSLIHKPEGFVEPAELAVGAEQEAG